MKFVNLIQENIQDNFRTQPIPLDEIGGMYEKVMKDLPSHFTVDKDVLDSFKIKNELNPEVWPHGKLSQQVRHKLIRIAKDFYKSMEVPPKVKIRDILLVGSMANFNWSKFSDIDLHIVVDFREFNDDLTFIKKFFDTNKNLYNLKHNIKIAGHDVELYVQDVHEKLSAAAVYSLVKNKWLLQPHEVDFKLDKNLIKRKIQKIFDIMKDIKKEYDAQKYKKVIREVEYLQNQLKKMRKAGLERGGEYSIENIIYKILRRTDILELLLSYKNKAYDNLVTI